MTVGDDSISGVCAIPVSMVALEVGSWVGISVSVAGRVLAGSLIAVSCIDVAGSIDGVKSRTSDARGKDLQAVITINKVKIDLNDLYIICSSCLSWIGILIGGYFRRLFYHIITIFRVRFSTRHFLHLPITAIFQLADFQILNL